MFDDNPEREERARERINVLLGHLRLGPPPGESREGFECKSDDERGQSAALQPGTSGGVVPAKGPKKSTWLDSLQMDPKLYWPRKYRYTIEPLPGSAYALSKKQRDHYEDEGYLIFRGLIPGVKMAGLTQIASRLTPTIVGTQQPSERDDLSNFTRVREVKKFIECFCTKDFGPMSVSKTIALPSLSNPLESAAGSHHDANPETNDKGSDPLHQDLFFLPLRPADRIVSVLIATRPMTRMNGCVQLVPATHRKGRIENVFSEFSEEHGGQSAGVKKMIYEPLIDIHSLQRGGPGAKTIELQPGDVMYYHPLLVHGLTANLLDNNPQLAGVTVHYASSECEVVECVGSGPFPEGVVPPPPGLLPEMSLDGAFCEEQVARSKRGERIIKWN